MMESTSRAIYIRNWLKERETARQNATSNQDRQVPLKRTFTIAKKSSSVNTERLIQVFVRFFGGRW